VTGAGKTMVGLSLFDGDGVFFANLDTAFTAKALFSIHRRGLAVYHFKNLDRADIDAFFTSYAFFLINRGDKSHLTASFE
jgi:hypothetical protein